MVKAIIFSLIIVIGTLVIFSIVSLFQAGKSQEYETKRTEIVVSAFERLSEDFANKFEQFASIQNDTAKTFFYGLIFVVVLFFFSMIFCVQKVCNLAQNSNKIFLLPNGEFKVIPMLQSNKQLEYTE